MRDDQLAKRAGEQLPLSDYYDEVLLLPDLQRFDPAQRCKAEANGEGDVLLADVSVEVPLHPTSLAGIQVGASVGGGSYYHQIIVVRYAGSMVLCSHPVVLPAVAPGTTCHHHTSHLLTSLTTALPCCAVPSRAVLCCAVCQQAAEVGLSPGGLARHLINMALSAAGHEPLLPPPAPPALESAAQWAQFTGANDTLSEITQQLADKNEEIREAFEMAHHTVRGSACCLVWLKFC